MNKLKEINYFLSEIESPEDIEIKVFDSSLSMRNKRTWKLLIYTKDAVTR